MDEKEKNIASLIVFWAAVLMICYPPTNSAEVASWVQGVGSIAAVIGAVVIGNRQLAAQREVALQERTGFYATIKAALDDVYKKAATVTDYASVYGYGSEYFVLSYPLARLEDGLSLLESIPIFQLKSKDLANAVVQMKMLIEILTKDFVSVKADFEERGNDVVKGYPPNSLGVFLEAFNTHYQAAVRITGGEPFDPNAIVKITFAKRD